MRKEYIEIPYHEGFKIRNLFSSSPDEIGRGDIAEIAPGGGGPVPSHSHPNGHLFIVIEGEVIVYIDDKTHTLSQYNSLVVPGGTRHKMINCTNNNARVLGIELVKTNNTVER